MNSLPRGTWLGPQPSEEGCLFIGNLGEGGGRGERICTLVEKKTKN